MRSILALILVSACATTDGVDDLAEPVPVVDATRCGGGAVAADSVPASEVELAAFFAIEFPRDLDFTTAREHSMNAFATWLEDTKARARTAANVYEPLRESTEPAQRVAAWARLTQIQRRFASLLVHAEIPVDVRTGEHAAEKIDAYCDALAAAAQPLLASADDSAARCREHATAVPAGWWTPVCAK